MKISIVSSFTLSSNVKERSHDAVLSALPHCQYELGSRSIALAGQLNGWFAHAVDDVVEEEEDERGYMLRARAATSVDESTSLKRRTCCGTERQF